MSGRRHERDAAYALAGLRAPRDNDMGGEFIGFRTIVGRYAGEPLYNMWLTDTRIIRCVDCDHCKESLDGKSLVCALRPLNQHRTDPYGFCHLAKPMKVTKHAKD